jgi:hypothetical protein
MALLRLASPAHADMIDGDWRHDDGRRFSFRGPTIVTPGGATIQGDYTRHSFQDTVPLNEAGGGQPISMTLRSETRINGRARPRKAHRCLAPARAERERVTAPDCGRAGGSL